MAQAPGVQNKRFPIAPSSFGVAARYRRSLNGKNLSKQWPAVVSAVRTECPSSAVHIVFEQMVLICHLVEGAIVA